MTEILRGVSIERVNPFGSVRDVVLWIVAMLLVGISMHFILNLFSSSRSHMGGIVGASLGMSIMLLANMRASATFEPQFRSVIIAQLENTGYRLVSDESSRVYRPTWHRWLVWDSNSVEISNSRDASTIHAPIFVIRSIGKRIGNAR